MEEQTSTQGISAEHASSDNVKESIEEIWYLKEISYKPDVDGPPRRYKIITQNFNGLAASCAACISPDSLTSFLQPLFFYCDL